MLPSHRGNIARFLSGINNFRPDGYKRQINVRSARFLIHNQAHVLLFACRNIAAGERLHYDYNALVQGQYSTQEFV
jgi:hypothetical protein